MDHAVKDTGGGLRNETAVKGAECVLHEKKLEVLAFGIDLCNFNQFYFFSFQTQG